jgi:FtsP/CotA-like multicopper oxidase with cupredoxin domain
MSRNQRIGLLVAAALVAVVAIVVAVASGGGDDNGSTNTTTQSQSDGTGTGTSSTSSTPSAPKPDVFRLQIKGGNPVGGVQDFKVKKGDKVTLIVTADAEDDIHVHGVDIEKPVAPGKPTIFRFTADTEGIFDIESHKAEDQGREPQMAKLTVEPD